MKIARLGQTGLHLIACVGLAQHIRADVIVDSQKLTITGDTDASPTEINGTPFNAVVIDGVATFYIKGDLQILGDQRVSVIGPRPVRLIAGNNAIIGNGALIYANAIGQNGIAGGGNGGVGAPSSGGGQGGDLQFGSESLKGVGGQGSTAVDCVASIGLQHGVKGADGVEGGSGDSGITYGGGYGKLGFGLLTGAGTPGLGGAFGKWGTPGAPGLGGARGNAGKDFGENGSDGQPGTSGTKGASGGSGFPGLLGADGQNSDLTPKLTAGSGGGGGGSGGSGGGGGGGGAGGQGGGGGGGMSLFCYSGGDGGSGGWQGAGAKGGKGGKGGKGAFGGGGGGAIEIAALGKLICLGAASVRGGDAGMPEEGTLGDTGDPANAGSDGVKGQYSKDAGSGGDGGRGGDGGAGGHGGFGSYGGGGGAGSGGTIKFSGAETILQGGVLDVRGGMNSNTVVGPGGRVVIGSNYVVSQIFNPLPSGIVPVEDEGPRETNPFSLGQFGSMSQTPYLASFVHGPAFAGVVPGLSASTLFPPSARPAYALAGMYVPLLPVGGLKYDTSKYRLLLYMNFASQPMVVPMMGIGFPKHQVPLRMYGWSTDPRFGGEGAEVFIGLSSETVYATLIPIAASSGVPATIGGTYLGVTRTKSTASLVAGQLLALTAIPCPADLNGDEMVDDRDFQIFLYAYNVLDCDDTAMPFPCASDFNNDEMVEDADFVIFLAAYNDLLCP